MKRFLFQIAIFYSLVSCSQNLPEGFVYLNTIDSSIKTELRYLSNNNFIGTTIEGYQRSTIIVSKPTAEALKKVQEKLVPFKLSLKIFDAYRPQQAVDHFVRWAKVMNDTVMKRQYFPDIPKSKLFELGYIAKKSGHTRGSTVDLTIIDLTTNKELDMGSPYDFFGIASHVINPSLNKQQQANRLLLRNLMLSNGFKPYENEWWHFTLKNEPYPKTYFDFPIK
jgi:D-alanyl-D-alanine dipeptidase